MNTNPQPDALRSRWTLAGEIPLAHVADGASWHRARSLSTGEDVVLFVVRGQAAPEAADAVRRAYLVEDPHLLPVRDIVVFDDPRDDAAEADRPADGGTPDASTDEPVTVVEYPVPGAPPLAALLADGPLHPETARAIIGEAATGLETARRRGVRHQLLDSNRVFVDTRSGEVVLLGIGVEAAAHPDLDRSREVASFQDTVSLVALLYRALTGRSPRPEADGHIPRPSTLVSTAVPEDLDLLCDLVLNESAEEIPETTRGLIEALEPWQSIPVTLEAYSRGSAPRAAEAPAPARPDPAVEDAASAQDEDELESTAMMAPVHDDEPVPDDVDEPGSPSEAAPAAGGAATGAAAAGVVAAGAAAAAPSPASASAAPTSPASSPAAAPAPPSTEPDPPAPSRSAPAESASGAVADGPTADGPTGDGPTGDGSTAAADHATAPEASQAAKELVDELHLDQKRAASPFPGHLDISSAQGTGAASPHAAPTGAAPNGTAPAPSAAPPAAAAGAAATAGGTAAPGVFTPGVAPSTSGAAPSTPSPAAPSAPASTPDYSAPTPQSPQSADVPGPVPVVGRTESLAPVRPDGPIVVHGRERSVSEQTPEESAGPTSRSSLLRDVVGVAVDDDAPGTFAMGPRDRDKRSLQSQWIIIGGAIVVMVALVVALTSITSDVRDLLDDPLATSAPPASPTPEEEETGEAPVEPTAEATEDPAPPPPELESVELFVQDSDREPDHTDQQDRLSDGDTSTYWSTKHYGSPDYGGLKGGVGMRLHFAELSTLTSVTLTTPLNNGGTVDLRAVEDDGSLGDVLSSGKFVADGEVRLDISEPVETEEVAVWISELPPDSRESGRFRARIAEIQVE